MPYANIPKIFLCVWQDNVPFSCILSKIRCSGARVTKRNTHIHFKHMNIEQKKNEILSPNLKSIQNNHILVGIRLWWQPTLFFQAYEIVYYSASGIHQQHHRDAIMHLRYRCYKVQCPYEIYAFPTFVIKQNRYMYIHNNFHIYMHKNVHQRYPVEIQAFILMAFRH